MLILGLDSSAAAGSCALCEVSGDSVKLVAESFINTKQTHSQTLMPMRENMLKSVGIGFDKLDRVAVTSGPGSFTGVRIGVSAAKGLGYALGIPCIGVSALHAVASGFAGFNGIICAVMDARRSQFYNALFSVRGGKPERITPDRAISAEDLEKELLKFNDKVFFAGDGAELASKLITNVEAELAPPYLRFPKASCVCFSSQEYEAVTAARLMPVYLRLPQAERERLAREKEHSGK